MMALTIALLVNRLKSPINNSGFCSSALLKTKCTWFVLIHQANLLLNHAIQSRGSGGKVKSGGSRVISCVKIVAESVFLLSIIDKGDKESISDKELYKLLKAAGLL